MTAVSKLLAAGLLAISLAGTATAQTTHSHGEPKASDAPSTMEFKKADAAMMRNMHVPYTGDADVDFRTHMIPHHQGAIDMAKVVLMHAKDPATQQMAQKIIDDQEREIAEMQLWLKQHGK